MPAPMVRYTLNDGTVVRFEIEPSDAFAVGLPGQTMVGASSHHHLTMVAGQGIPVYRFSFVSWVGGG